MNNKAHYYAEDTSLELIDWEVLVEPFEQRTTLPDQCDLWHAQRYFWAIFGAFIIMNFYYAFAHFNSMSPLLFFMLQGQLLYLCLVLDMFVPTQLAEFYRQIGVVTMFEWTWLEDQLA